MRPHLILAFLLSRVLAYAQVQQCVQSEFSGEAAQGQQFTQELGACCETVGLDSGGVWLSLVFQENGLAASRTGVMSVMAMFHK
jgi:hypothetical protein